MPATCAHCGAPSPAGAFCARCGSPLPSPAAHPQPRPPPPPRARPPYQDSYTATASKPSTFVLAVVIFLVAALVVGGLGVLYVLGSFSNAPPPPGLPASGLHITGVRVASPDDACGLNGDDSGTVSNQPAVGYPTITWGLPGPSGHVPCTVETVASNTSGFVLIASLPQTTTSFPGVLIVSILEPSTYSGVLNVTFT